MPSRFNIVHPVVEKQSHAEMARSIKPAMFMHFTTADNPKVKTR